MLDKWREGNDERYLTLNIVIVTKAIILCIYASTLFVLMEGEFVLTGENGVVTTTYYSISP